MSAASLRRRLGAFAIDYVFLVGWIALLTAVVFAQPPLRAPFEGGPAAGQAAAFLVLTLPITLYFAFFEGSPWRATPGKRMLGLTVVRPDGRRVTLARSLVRSALKFVPWELAHTFLWRIPGWPMPDGPLPANAIAGFVVVWLLVLANIVVALRSPRRQTLYDRSADTVVVRLEAGRA